MIRNSKPPHSRQSGHGQAEQEVPICSVSGCVRYRSVTGDLRYALGMKSWILYSRELRPR
jgi:hypothetical protein